ncbi:helicase associated domain-containing protein [Colletotrichum orchidophilum]|uniref:RNA helicase n=1 Tax=Colletotrichum orchidophilum TaxID=1209926 RepID=A0A1G4B651_9PEZI|nr:helicase associated domain-containing protein [Colletotrichum orchidophilum]OHE96772.1 helicase associated domain-containing protein [Colletotrichum orchidophilum]
MGKFVPRQRKHKVLARERSKENGVIPQDSNADEILPEDQKRLQDKRAQLKAELQGDGAKPSGKKAKRLEKYITNKLRKDENREILAKLAQQKVDTSLFTSTKTLGQGKESKRQALTRALREKNAGLEVDADAEELLYEKRDEAPEADSEDSEYEAPKAPKLQASMVTVKAPAPAPAPATTSKSTSETSSQAPASAPAPAPAPASKPEPKPAASTGSGLKRPLDVDEAGRPVLRKRQKRGGVVSKFSIAEPEKAKDAEDEWNGLSDDAEGKSSDEENSSAEESEQSSEGSDESEEDDDEDDEDGSTSTRQSAFKAWALAQRNEALGFESTTEASTALEIPRPENFEPRPLEQEPLPQELQPTTNLARKAYSVAVTRTPEIQEVRMKLPVVAEEQKIMEMIHNNDIVVVCGSTGSGKTTQVPQFLYEAGYGSPGSATPGMIGVTQPRRVAAVSMSKRVGQELGDHSDRVGYQIRFEGTASAKTAIKFMTDGVLLREMAQDFSLKKYSAIIIDEAHERSVNTDILIGMLSRINNIRKGNDKVDPSIKPLKIIIMSATLRVEDMTNNTTLFPTPPPVVEVEGRQHPVTIHFSRRTQSDFVEEAFNKIMRGHKKLPPGGFLVFLTGQNEIRYLSKRLREAFGGFTEASAPKVQISATDAPMEVEDIDFGEVDDTIAADIDDGLDEDEDMEHEDDKEFDIEGEEGETGPMKMQVLPLYSLLPTREQMRVFEDPPENHRQVILATNVAETSLTIPGIRYVFDCGRSKERQYDRFSGVQTYEIGWISKASASQRAGRAGRTGPGHCYRLYSSAVYERDLPEFTDPEILRMPVDGVVLQLKAMNLSNVVNFPFPTPPNRMGLRQAEKLLTYLSAIAPEGQITKIGSTMSIFPLSPRFARILLVGHQHDCLPYTIMMVAALSAAEIFVPEHQAIPSLAARDESEFRRTADIIAEDRQANIRRLFNAAHKNFCYLDDRSDAIKLLQVVGEYAHDPTEKWCEDHFVRYKVMKEVTQLRQQITELLRANIPAFKNLKYQERLDAPSDKQVAYLKQMVAAGFIDHVALRADKSPVPPEVTRKPGRAIDVPYIPLSPLGVGHGAEKLVYIHPTSPLAHLSPQECPEFVVYSQLQRATQGADVNKTPKTRMLALTDVTGGQLASLAKGTPLVSYGKPVKEISSTANTREVWVVPYLRAEGVGGQGWPLPMKKVVQRRVAGKGWVVE